LHSFEQTEVGSLDGGSSVRDIDAGTIASAFVSYPLTEDGVAQAFALTHGEDRRFWHGPDLWYLWDGTCWRSDRVGQTYDDITLLARAMAAASNKAAAAFRLGKASFAAGVERLVRSRAPFRTTPATWDTEPFLAGTPEGTLDLHTGTLRAACRDDAITKLLAVAPAPPGTPAPLWDAFLQQATGHDAALMSFLYRVLGYCLTGDVREETLFFLFGPGGAGKGTLIRTVGRIFGDYARAADIATFTETRSDRHTQELARLAGARLVTASEPEAGTRWKWARIRELTGHERPLTARHLYRDDTEFEVTCKLLVVGNHQPKLPATDRATARRFLLIPFSHPPQRPDTTLKDRLVLEYPAILRRIVDGARDWQRHGLNPPPAVRDATTGALAEHDLRARWIQDCCILDANAAATPAELYQSWTAYRRQAGGAEQASESMRAFSFALQSSGLAIRRRSHVADLNNRRGYAGIRLKQTTEHAASG
jgi:putative DNA primase/helicase